MKGCENVLGYTFRAAAEGLGEEPCIVPVDI